MEDLTGETHFLHDVHAWCDGLFDNDDDEFVLQELKKSIAPPVWMLLRFGFEHSGRAVRRLFSFDKLITRQNLNDFVKNGYCNYVMEDTVELLFKGITDLPVMNDEDSQPYLKIISRCQLVLHPVKEQELEQLDPEQFKPPPSFWRNKKNFLKACKILEDASEKTSQSLDILSITRGSFAGSDKECVLASMAVSCGKTKFMDKRFFDDVDVAKECFKYTGSTYDFNKFSKRIQNNKELLMVAIENFNHDSIASNFPLDFIDADSELWDDLDVLYSLKKRMQDTFSKDEAEDEEYETYLDRMCRKKRKREFNEIVEVID